MSPCRGNSTVTTTDTTTHRKRREVTPLFVYHFALIKKTAGCIPQMTCISGAKYSTCFFCFSLFYTYTQRVEWSHLAPEMVNQLPHNFAVDWWALGEFFSLSMYCFLFFIVLNNNVYIVNIKQWTNSPTKWHVSYSESCLL